MVMNLLLFFWLNFNCRIILLIFRKFSVNLGLNLDLFKKIRNTNLEIQLNRHLLTTYQWEQLKLLLSKSFLFSITRIFSKLRIKMYICLYVRVRLHLNSDSLITFCLHLVKSSYFLNDYRLGRLFITNTIKQMLSNNCSN